MIHCNYKKFLLTRKKACSARLGNFLRQEFGKTILKQKICQKQRNFIQLLTNRKGYNARLGIFLRQEFGNIQMTEVKS